MSNFKAKLMVAAVMLLSFFALASLNVQAAEQAPTLEKLLQQVKQGSAQERREQKAREAQFLTEKQQQAKRLAAAKRELAKLEQRSKVLEKTYDANAKAISEKKEVLSERLGVLKDLFGTVQAVAGDARANLQTSLISVQHHAVGQYRRVAPVVVYPATGDD